MWRSFISKGLSHHKDKKSKSALHHHHYVPEGLGVFPVPWSSRWSWSLHLFLGRPMFLWPFGLYCSACFGSLFVSILCTCCSHFFWYCFISFTMFCTPVFSLIHWFFSLSSFVIPSKCLKNFICAASKRCSSLFLVIGVIQMLICKTHKSWENQPQQQRRLCRQILLPRPRRLWLCDPWAMQLKLQQAGEGADESPAP